MGSILLVVCEAVAYFYFGFTTVALILFSLHTIIELLATGIAFSETSSRFKQSWQATMLMCDIIAWVFIGFH